MSRAISGGGRLDTLLPAESGGWSSPDGGDDAGGARGGG
jgi:hypothetical protein